MDKIFGDIGDLIIFDTNGIHSNFKLLQFQELLRISLLKILEYFRG